VVSTSGLKALSAILSDPNVNELMWNSFDHAFIEFNGVLQSIPSPFTTLDEFKQTLAALSRIRNTVHTQGMIIDGVMADGSRFHITWPPLSPDGPTLTVRKFSSRHRGLSQLVTAGFMSRKLSTFLEGCVKGRVNILVSGSTGAGKTNLLNTLASLASPSERIITIEDVPELQLKHGNWVRLVASSGQGAATGSENGSESGRMTVQDCLVGCLRMRPDRIIIGECRSGEAQGMLETMNSGHDGGMTTIHANSTGDALSRLETLVLFHVGIEVPIRILRRRISDAIDLVIQVKKTSDGKRFIDEVIEVVGMEGEIITRLSLFKHAEGSNPGGLPRLISTGHPPTFLKRLELNGVQLPKGFFDPHSFESAA
jgi:pilus assembly protein CpaF